MKELTREVVAAALTGDAGAIRALVAELTPVIHARAVRVLLRRRVLAKGTDVRQVLDDMMQDVFVELFREDGKALRVWDPARGLGLRGFVGLVAEQHVAALLRVRCKNPWAEDLTVDDAGHEEAAEAADDPERRAASRRSSRRCSTGCTPS